MPYNAGDAYLRIIPTFKGIALKINADAKKWGIGAGHYFSGGFNDIARKETANADVGPSTAQSTRSGAASGGAFARSFRARVDAALKALPDIDVDADATPAERKIAEIRAKLQALRDAHLDVDLDSAAAMAQITAIQTEIKSLARSSPSIRVDVDSARAMAELAAISGAAAAVGSQDISIDPDTSGVDRYGAKIGALTGAFAALLAISGPVAGALSAVAVAGVTAMGAIAGGAIVGALGISDVSNAVELLGKRQDAAKKAAQGVSTAMGQQANAAAAVESAERSLQHARESADDAAITAAQRVASARKALVDAETQGDKAISRARQQLAQVRTQAARSAVDAARRVRDAERDLADVQKRSTDAQQALNDARAQAVRDLQDYANSAADANLALQQAQIDLADAQKQLATDQAGGTDADLNVQEKQLALARAQAKLDADRLSGTKTALELNQSQLDVARAQDALAAARAAGATSPDTIKQSALNVAKAQQNLAEAQLRAQRATVDNNAAQQAGVDGAPAVVSSAQQIADAQQAQIDAVQRLADARQSQADGAQDSAQRIADAQQSVADATEAASDRIIDAQQRVADSLRAQTKQASDSAFSLAQARAALESAQRAGAGGGAASGVSALADIDAQLAKVNPATLALANLIQNKVKPAFEQLKSAAAESLAPGLIAGLLSLASLMPQATEFVSSVASTLGGLFAQAADSLAGPFWGRFFAYVQENAGPMLTVLASIAGGLTKGLAGLMMAFQPVTDVIMQTLADWSQQFADWATSDGVQKFVDYILQTGPAVASAVGSAIGMVIHLADAFSPLGVVILNIIDGIGQIVQSLSPTGLSLAFAGIGLFASTLGGPVTAMAGLGVAAAGLANLIASNWSKIQPVVQPVIDAFNALWRLIVDHLVPVITGLLSDAWDGIKSGIDIVMKQVDRFRPELEALWEAFKLVAGAIIDMIRPILGPILKAAFEFLGALIGAAIAAIGSLIDAGAAVVTWFKGPFVDFFKMLWNSYLKPPVEAVISAFKAAWGFVYDYVISPVKTAWDWVAGKFDTVKGWVKSQAEDIANVFKVAWGFIYDYIVQPVQKAWGIVSQAFNAVKDWVGDRVEGIANVFKKAWAFVYDYIITPIKDAIAWVKQKWLEFGEWILNNSFTSTVAQMMGLGGAVQAGRDALAKMKAEDEPRERVGHLASGGMVTGPVLAMVGDNPSGREIALPLDSPATVTALSRALAQAMPSPRSQQTLEGNLYLDDGTFLGKVRGVVADQFSAKARAGRMRSMQGVPA